MSTSAQRFVERLLHEVEERSRLPELIAFAKHSPALVGELGMHVESAARAGRCTADFAESAMRVLAWLGGSQERTQLRAGPASDLLQPEAPPVPGMVIKGRFELQHELGHGGMGLVFAAIDRRKQETRDPNPHIAIKVLKGDFQHDRDLLIALQREARKAQTLAHPNVVTVFDFDRDGSRVFMTMELLRGRSLDTVVREARGVGIDRDTALAIIRGIAEGLAYAHRKGIVHSDLKPGNVFVLEDGTPKLLDFGIARAVPSPGAERDTFDAGSLGAYTEAYATREMIEGLAPHPADDVYGFALIACELLSGTHPFQRKSALEAYRLGLKPMLPKSLSRRERHVLEAALAFDRAKRPKDAGEFISQFFGATRLKKAAIAAVALLAVVVGLLVYRDYRQSEPVVAFEDLPQLTQQQFAEAMSAGDASWDYYERDRNVIALYDAVDAYSGAYELHPRNRRATRALLRAADALLEAAAKTPEERKAVASGLMSKSELLAKHKPVVAAAGR
jgi:predicted Ser/Thr protein kinase